MHMAAGSQIYSWIKRCQHEILVFVNSPPPKPVCSLILAQSSQLNRAIELEQCSFNHSTRVC